MDKKQILSTKDRKNVDNRGSLIKEVTSNLFTQKVMPVVPDKKRTPVYLKKAANKLAGNGYLTNIMNTFVNKDPLGKELYVFFFKNVLSLFFDIFHEKRISFMEDIIFNSDGKYDVAENNKYLHSDFKSTDNNHFNTIFFLKGGMNIKYLANLKIQENISKKVIVYNNKQYNKPFERYSTRSSTDAIPDDKLGIFSEESFSDLDFGLIFVTDNEIYDKYDSPSDSKMYKRMYANMILHLYYRTAIFRDIMSKEMLAPHRLGAFMKAVQNKNSNALLKGTVVDYSKEDFYQFSQKNLIIDKSNVGAFPVQLSTFLKTSKYGFDLLRIKMRFKNGNDLQLFSEFFDLSIVDLDSREKRKKLYDEKKYIIYGTVTNYFTIPMMDEELNFEDFLNSIYFTNSEGYLLF